MSDFECKYVVRGAQNYKPVAGWCYFMELSDRANAP